MTQIWVNNVKKSQVSAFDRGLAYGDGVFATMRVANHSILFVDTHLARLSEGAERLGFSWHASDHLRQALTQLAIDNNNACIKLMLTRGEGGRGYQAPAKPSPMVMVSVHDIPDHYTDWQKTGVRLASSQVMLSAQPLLAGIKHSNRLEQVLIKSAPLVDNCHDWLVRDANHHIIESSAGNLFFIKGNTAYSAKLTHCGVSGVMRQQVIMALLSQGMNVCCIDITNDMLNQCEHVIMTNSLYGMLDVIAIDGKPYIQFAQTQAILASLGFPII